MVNLSKEDFFFQAVSPILKAGFHMIADRRSQIAIRSAIVIADDRRR